MYTSQGQEGGKEPLIALVSFQSTGSHVLLITIGDALHGDGILFILGPSYLGRTPRSLLSKPSSHSVLGTVRIGSDIGKLLNCKISLSRKDKQCELSL